MYCIKCGTKNEDGSKFCVSCGSELEENVEQKQESKEEKIAPPTNKKVKTVEELKNIEETKVEEKVEVKEEIKKVDNVTVTNTPKKSNTAMIIAIIVGALFLLSAVGVAGLFIYKDFVKEKTIEKPSTPTTPKTPSSTPTNEDDWEFSYKIPEGFKEEEYSDSNIKFFKYKNDTDFCSLTLWKVDYIPNGSTEESLLRSHSNIDKQYQQEIKATSYPINKINWISLKREDTWNTKTEFGKLNDDKTNFYMILYSDYSPSSKTCETKLKELLKSIKY
jgi:hypothetical protein